MSRYGLRGRFGMVLQDIWLYEGAIRESLVCPSPVPALPPPPCCPRCHLSRLCPFDLFRAPKSYRYGRLGRKVPSVARGFVFTIWPHCSVVRLRSSETKTRTACGGQCATMLLRKGTLSPFLSPFFYSKELLARWLRRKVAKPAFWRVAKVQWQTQWQTAV